MSKKVYFIKSIIFLAAVLLVSFSFISYLVANADEGDPEVLSITLLNDNPTQDQELVFEVTFSEEVSGLDGTDFQTAVTGTIAGESITNIAVADVVAGTVGETIYTGSGLDDAVFSGEFNSTAIGCNVILGIDSLAPGNGLDNDTFIFGFQPGQGECDINDSIGDGAPISVEITPGVAQYLGGGVYVTFESGTGHTAIVMEGFLNSWTADLNPGSGGAVYRVTIDRGTGYGTLHLAFLDDDSVIDADLNPVGGTGINNGDFTTADEYIIPAMLGAGTEEVPYQVTDCEQLQLMSDDLSAYYQLQDDIDCSDTVSWNGGQGFHPVGSAENPFTGSLHGAGNTISDLFIDRSEIGSYEGVGLFGALRGAEIHDVVIANADITGSESVGILAGFAGGLFDSNTNTLTELQDRSTISGVVTSGSVSGLSNVGGLAGILFATTLTESSSSAQVTASLENESGRKMGQFFGGLIGTVGTGSIIDTVYATGDIDGGNLVGGLIGGTLLEDQNAVLDSEDYMTIQNAYATGQVASSSISGGFAGSLRYINVQHAYATGNVSQSFTDFNGALMLGGFAGVAQNAIIMESYATGNVTGYMPGGFVGAMIILGGGDPFNDSQVFITQSHAIGDVIGVLSPGGFVSLQSGGEIISSYATGNVVAEPFTEGEVSLPGVAAGGFIGSIFSDAVIENSYATGSVTAEDIAGGFIGIDGAFFHTEVGDWVLVPTTGYIENTYATGQVSVGLDAEFVGGFMGRNMGESEIVASFYDNQTTGQTASVLGVGASSAEMKNITTYTGWDIQSSTDDRLQYPTLSWQLDLETPVWLIYQAPLVSQPRRSSGSSTLESRALAQQVFADHYATQGKAIDTPSQAEDILGSGLCPANLIVTDNMKQGDRDGKYSSYNQGTVTQVALLQSHINRILAATYDQAAGPVDGMYGPLTAQGVRRLQTALNEILVPTPLLVIDGIVGPFTKDAINNSCGDVASIS